MNKVLGIDDRKAKTLTKFDYTRVKFLKKKMRNKKTLKESMLTKRNLGNLVKQKEHVNQIPLKQLKYFHVLSM